MPAPFSTLLASTLMFPSYQYQETGIEGFGVETVEPGANAPFELGDLAGGFGIQSRAVVAGKAGNKPRWGTTARVRFRFEDGIHWEDVLVSPGPIVILAQPDFGTIFEFGIGPYQNDFIVYAQDSGTIQTRLFLPVTLNPASLANTDQDGDKRLKYLFRAGLGAGVDLTAGIGAKLLLGVRFQGDYRYSYRAGALSTSHNRGESELLLDAGVGFRTSENTALMASFIYQDRRQWTYDGPIEGPGRGSQLIGARISLRLYQKGAATPPPAPAPTAPPEPLGKPTSPT